MVRSAPPQPRPTQDDEAAPTAARAPAAPRLGRRPQARPETVGIDDTEAHPEATSSFRMDDSDADLSRDPADADIEHDDTEAQKVQAERLSLWGRWDALERRWNSLPTAMMVTSLLLGLGIVQMTFQLGNSLYRSLTWQQETHATLNRIHGLQHDIHILKTAEQAASDPLYLEQMARCQGFVSKNEQIVVSSQAPSTPPGETCEVVRLP